MSGTGPEGTAEWLPRRALVIGLARSGQAAALALARRGVEVVAADRSPDADPGRLAEAGVEVRSGSEEESLLEGVEVVVKSPGVPAESPLAAAARARGIPIWSEVELGYRLLDGNPLIGVTGTNGKTTTSELLGAILRSAGRRVEVAGNVGRTLTDVAEQIEPGVSVVCELSSFQLEDVHEFTCDVAVLLNLEPDHLDRHGTFEAYRDAKLRIFERAHAKIVPRGLGLDGIEFAADDPLPAEPRIPGLHNRENAAAATAAARAAGVGDDAIADALQHLRRRAAPARARARVARRSLRQRLQGDEHRGRAPRRRRLRRAPSADPRRLAQGRGLRRRLRATCPRTSARSTSSARRRTSSPQRSTQRAGRTARRRPRPRARARERRRRGRRHRAALARGCELRPVRQLRAAWRCVPRGSSRGSHEPAAAKQHSLEWQLLVLVPLALTAFGLVMVYSATSSSAALGNGNPIGYLERQAAYALIGIALMICRGPHRLPQAARARAAASCSPRSCLCVAVLAIGERINGARRWIGFGPAAFQPSELAKLAIVVWCAAYLARKPPPRTLKDLARPLGLLVGVFCLLILVEPDLGTVITIVVMVGAMLLVAGTPLPTLATAYGIVFGLAAIASWASPYRRARLLVFLDPWKDPTNNGLQNVQALISLGSGGIFGRGLGQGVLKNRYLPEAHTDMIFAVIGEELGLIGLSLVMLAYCALAYAGLRLALTCKDPFGKRLAAGITALITGQAAINLAAVARACPADRDSAAVRLVRRLEPRDRAPVGRDPP